MDEVVVISKTSYDVILEGYLQEIQRCNNCIISKIQSINRRDGVSKYSALASLAISIILDIVPVFVPETEQSWYHILTMSCTLCTFVVGVYWERSDFGTERQLCFNTQEQLNSVKSSIQRTFSGAGKTKDMQEYIKRINEKLGMLKMAAKIFESL